MTDHDTIAIKVRWHGMQSRAELQRLCTVGYALHSILQTWTSCCSHSRGRRMHMCAALSQVATMVCPDGLDSPDLDQDLFCLHHIELCSLSSYNLQDSVEHLLQNIALQATILQTCFGLGISTDRFTSMSTRDSSRPAVLRQSTCP